MRTILLPPDEAGIREAAADPVEKMGIERSRSSLELAEIVFWVFDASALYDEEIRRMRESVPEHAAVIAVWNKTDLLNGTFTPPETGVEGVALSARTGEGIEKLEELFEQAVWKNGGRSEPECAVSARHVRALEQADAALEEACREIGREEFDLAAGALRAAVAAVASITGEGASPDVLEEIFSRFCIGK